jgi:hypothetical protein
MMCSFSLIRPIPIPLPVLFLFQFLTPFISFDTKEMCKCIGKICTIVGYYLGRSMSDPCG